jgi:hypothetical protein
VEIDFPQLLAVDPGPGLGPLRVVSIRNQQQRFPRGFEAGYELAFH